MSSISFTKTPASIDPEKTVISKERRLVEARINPHSVYVLFTNIVTEDGEVIADKPISTLPIPLTDLPPEVLSAVATVVDYLNARQDAAEQASKDALAAPVEAVSSAPNP